MAPHAQGGFLTSKTTNSTDIASSHTAHSLTQAPNTNVIIQQKPPLAPNPPCLQSHPHPCLQPCPPISTMTCMSITIPQIPTMVVKSEPIEDRFKDTSNHNSVIILNGDDSSDEFQHETIKPLPAPDIANHDMDVENFDFDIEESQVGLEDAERDLVINSPATSRVQSKVSANVIFYNFTLMPDEQELVMVKESTPEPQIHPQRCLREIYNPSTSDWRKQQEHISQCCGANFLHFYGHSRHALEHLTIKNC